MADASQSVKDMCSFGLPLKIDNTAKARFATTPKTTPQETGPPLDPGKENTALVVQAPSNPSDARPGKALCERNNSITLSTGANVNRCPRGDDKQRFIGWQQLPDADER
jgi:hypothetical protein